MSDEDCKDCLNAIGQLRSEIGELKGALDNSNQSIMKIFYALIGLAGASVGSKFIGTPWHVEVAMHAALFGAIFVLLITLAKWQCLSFWEKWIRFSFVLAMFYSFGLRVVHYQFNTPFTQAEGVISNIFYTSLALGFICLAWQRDAKRRKRRRRHDDV